MSETAAQAMDVDEFLVWGRERQGRFELHDGVVVAMAPERFQHVEAKLAAVNALQAAIVKAGVPCRALIEGMAVRVSKVSAFIPDAMVFCGSRPDPSALEIPDPVVVVEVLSPSTASVDFGLKLEGYFRIPSVAHYLVIDAERRKVVHYLRSADDRIEVRILGEGELILDPPGIVVPIRSLTDRE